MEPASATVVVTVSDETSDDAGADLARWADLVTAVLTDEGVVGPAEANVLFVDAPTMTELNEQHMGVSGPTDVLSFPIDDGDDDPSGGMRFVGDVVVCREVAEANAPGHAGSIDDEIALLLVHGSLHLLGHDHSEADERSVMWGAERRLLDRHWGPLAADPWGAAQTDPDGDALDEGAVQ